MHEDNTKENLLLSHLLPILLIMNTFFLYEQLL